MILKNKRIKTLQAEIDKLKKVNSELNSQKKYGLVWEDKPEIFDELSKNVFPIIRCKDDKKYPDIHNLSEKGNQQSHILIEGDNYHTLSVLNITHQNKIDVIYIDPPYNTGNKDFKYNDSFVDKEDKFRHSKWLSFMYKRLELAKNLLTDDGIIFISIDDNEQAQLKLLCDEVFGEKNQASNIVWQSNKNIMKGSNYIRKDHEYILVYVKPLLSKIRLENKELKFQNIDNDPKGDWLNTNATYTNGGYRFAIKLPNSDECIRNWRFTEQHYLDNEVVLYFNNGNVPRLKIYKDEYDLFTKIPSSLILDFATTTTGKNSLANIFNCLPKDVPFNNPKDEKLISYLLSFKNKNVIILDFMAGSGTTAHAVLELNKQDGGNRQCILATNNENSICENITYQRVKRVIEGYTTPKGKEVAGLGGMLLYLKTDFVPKTDYRKISNKDKINFSHQVGIMLALKENTFNQVKSNNYYQIFSSDTKICGIYFSENLIELDELVDFMLKQDKPCCLYACLKLDKADFVPNNNNIILNEIPEYILQIYKILGSSDD